LRCNTNHWQDIERLITRNINSTLSRAVEEIPGYKKSLEFAQNKNFYLLNTSIDDIKDILCRATDFGQAETRRNEIIQISAQVFASVCSLARSLSVGNKSSLIESLASNTQFTDIKRLVVSLNSYLETNQLDEIEFSNPIKPTTATTEIVSHERPLVVQPKAENKNSLFFLISNKFFAVLSLILARFHLHHLAPEIITMLILSLDRESGKNRQVFSDRAKEIIIIRNIDPDLAIAYANAHNALANIRPTNLYERGSIYQEDVYSKDLPTNFDDSIYMAPQEGGLEREVAIGLGQRIAHDLELKNATLFQHDLHEIERYIAKNFISSVNVGRSNNKHEIKDGFEGLSNLTLLIQIVHLILQTLSRGKVITKNQSNPILQNLDRLVSLIRTEQLDLSLLSLRIEGRAHSYESVRIVKERKPSEQYEREKALFEFEQNRRKKSRH